MPRGIKGISDKGTFVDVPSDALLATVGHMRRPLNSLTSWHRNRYALAVAPPAQWNGRDARGNRRKNRASLIAGSAARSGGKSERRRERPLVRAHGGVQALLPPSPLTPKSMIDNGEGLEENEEMPPLLSNGAAASVHRSPPIKQPRRQRQVRPIVMPPLLMDVPAATQRKPPRVADRRQPPSRASLLMDVPARNPPRVADRRQPPSRASVDVADRSRTRNEGAFDEEDDVGSSLKFYDEDDDGIFECCCRIKRDPEHRCWGEGTKNLCTIALWALILWCAASRFFYHLSSHNRSITTRKGGGGNGNIDHKKYGLRQSRSPSLRSLLEPESAVHKDGSGAGNAKTGAGSGGDLLFDG